MRLTVLACFSMMIAGSACAAAGGDSVNLTYDDDGRPVAEVVINGEATFPFVIDTAAQASAVGRPIVEQLGLEPDPHRKAQLHGATGVTLVDLYPLKSIRLGGYEKSDLLAPLLQHEKNRSADGIVGADVFKSTGIAFDFRDNRARAGAPLVDGEAIDIDLRYGIFAIAPVEMGGVEASAVFDTGARHTVGNLALMRALGVDSSFLRTTKQALGVSGHAATSFEGYDSSLHIGSAEMANVSIVFNDAAVFAPLGLTDKPALIVGMDVIHRLQGIAIDYVGEKLIVAD